jgi:hypothetical protein
MKLKVQNHHQNLKNNRIFAYIKVTVLLQHTHYLDQLLHGFGHILAIIHLWIIVECIYVRPKATGLRTWRASYRIRGGIWPMPYISCNYLYCSRTTRAVVEQVGIEGNYPVVLG